MRTLLCDVDGCAADLIGGFIEYFENRFGIVIPYISITRFHMDNSPELQWLVEAYDLYGVFEEFMALPNVYQDYVHPIPGSGILNMIQGEIEPVFITATMKKVPESYTSKVRWLHERFPDIPVVSCPAGLKYKFRADWIIDDRYDTCAKFEEVGTKPLLFRQPWNEAPDGVDAYDWDAIAVVLNNAIALGDRIKHV